MEHSPNTFTPSPAQIIELDRKVSVILKDILGTDSSKTLQKKIGNIHIHDTRIGMDVMKNNFTSSARADTAIKQAIVAQLLDYLPEDMFFNPVKYDPDTAIRHMAEILTKDTAPADAAEPEMPEDIDEDTEV